MSKHKKCSKEITGTDKLLGIKNAFEMCKKERGEKRLNEYIGADDIEFLLICVSVCTEEMIGMKKDLARAMITLNKILSKGVTREEINAERLRQTCSCKCDTVA